MSRGVRRIRFAPGRAVRPWALLGLAVGCAVAPLSGQSWDPANGRATRQQLEQLLSRYQLAAQSRAYSPVLRQEARDEAKFVQDRLEKGDFRPGDLIYVDVDQQAELTDTVRVTEDRSIRLPGIGDIALAGVLRSELVDRVKQDIARMVREPRVRTRVLLRISMMGGVGSPGFYTFDSNTVLSDALMAAGGLTPAARERSIHVDRAGTTIVGGDEFQRALRQGITIDELGLRDGDRIVVPQRQQNVLRRMRELMFIIPSALGLISILR